MTSLVALATRDALVMGCDSLGTTTKHLVDPLELSGFFDASGGAFPLKIGVDGKPLLKDLRDIWQKGSDVPFSHMTHMTKLFSLEPLPIGLMITGIMSIGDRSIRSLVEEFSVVDKAARLDKETSAGDVNVVAERFREFVFRHYEKAFPDESQRPALEFIIGGFNEAAPLPAIYRVNLPANKVIAPIEGPGIVFGGVMKEIQRIVFGTDTGNWLKVSERHRELLKKYREKVNLFLKEKNVAVEVPEPTVDEIDKQELGMFSGGWTLDQFDAEWANFSEQNAIECVDFFVNIMVKSQQFSPRMPTVGGEVHIALITKAGGFRFISCEEFTHGGHRVTRVAEPKEK